MIVNSLCQPSLSPVQFNAIKSPDYRHPEHNAVLCNLANDWGKKSRAHFCSNTVPVDERLTHHRATQQRFGEEESLQGTCSSGTQKKCNAIGKSIFFKFLFMFCLHSTLLCGYAYCTVFQSCGNNSLFWVFLKHLPLWSMLPCTGKWMESENPQGSEI